MWKYEKQFRIDNPQTIGETDKHFDLDNYKDWLEEKLSIFYPIEHDKDSICANCGETYSSHSAITKLCPNKFFHFSPS